MASLRSSNAGVRPVSEAVDTEKDTMIWPQVITLLLFSIFSVYFFLLWQETEGPTVLCEPGQVYSCDELQCHPCTPPGGPKA
jgi:hypothetical protein